MSIKKLRVTKLASDLGYNKMLTFRPEGKRAKKYIEEEIDRLQSGDVLELDFSGIELCDVSFVDEMLIEVQLYMRNLSMNVIMVVSNINESTLENLQGALAYRETKGERVPLLLRQGSGYSPIGSLEPVLEETFKQVAKNKRVSARDIASLDNVAINSASNKLKKLYDYRLIMRDEIVDTEGRQFIYRIPE